MKWERASPLGFHARDKVQGKAVWRLRSGGVEETGGGVVAMALAWLGLRRWVSSKVQGH
jgi:hypothetical protein